MTKKLVAVIVFILVFFYCINSDAVTVKENSKLEITEKEEIENLIEENTDGVWNLLECDLYDESMGTIYKLTDEETVNKVTVLSVIQDNAIIRILKNGYPSKDISDLNVSTEDDAYLATNLALMALENEYSNIDEHYRVNASLNDEQLKQRASKILALAKRLLNIGLNGEETYTANVEVTNVGEFEKDSVYDGMYSQTFEVNVDNGELVEYQVIADNDIGEELKLVNDETNEIQEIFSGNEKRFRLLISEEKAQEDFMKYLRMSVTINTDKAYYMKDSNNNKYIIFLKKDVDTIVFACLDNRDAALTINFVDEETNKRSRRMCNYIL